MKRREFLKLSAAGAAALAVTACGGSSSSTTTAASTATSTAASSTATAAATDYPKKGISVICPWSAGGGTDACLRALLRLWARTSALP